MPAKNVAFSYSIILAAAISGSASAQTLTPRSAPISAPPEAKSTSLSEPPEVARRTLADGERRDLPEVRELKLSKASVLAPQAKATTVSVAEGSDYFDTPWYMFGPSWVGIDYGTHDVAQSGPAWDSESSGLFTTVTGPANVTFDWQVSSELDWDYLNFLVWDWKFGEFIWMDGISGDVSLQPAMGGVILSLPDGSFDLDFHYDKDESISWGDDAGAIDQLKVMKCTYSVEPLAMVYTRGEEVTANWSATGAGCASSAALQLYDVTAAGSAYAQSYQSDIYPDAAAETLLGYSSPGSTRFSTSALAAGREYQFVVVDSVNDYFYAASDPFTLAAASEIDDATDYYGTWLSEGFIGQGLMTYDGVDAAKSVDNDFSYLALEGLTGPGRLSFYWKAEEYASIDVATNNATETVIVNEIYGPVDWVQQNVDVLDNGEFFVDWAAWGGATFIDQVVFQRVDFSLYDAYLFTGSDFNVPVPGHHFTTADLLHPAVVSFFDSPFEMEVVYQLRSKVFDCAGYVLEPPGNSVTYCEAYGTFSEGVHVLDGVVDAYGEFDETDETNNRVRYEFNVTGGELIHGSGMEGVPR